MKRIFIGLFLLFFASAANAQTYGKWQIITSPRELGPDLSGIPVSSMTWPSPDTGIFFGYNSSNADPLTLFQGDSTGTNYVQLASFPTPNDTLGKDTNGKYIISHYTEIQYVTDMSWPSPTTGVVLGTTYADNYGHNSRPIMLVTTNAGSTWNSYFPSDTSDLYTNVFFADASVGFASAGAPDGSAYYIEKSTNGGKNWTQVYSSSSETFKSLYFRDENNGLVNGVTGNNINQVLYTTNGGTSFQITTVPTDSLAKAVPFNSTFVHWNDDSSWLVAADSVYRSTDSGKTWTGVVSYDPTNGPAGVGAFYKDSGFVFRSNGSVLMTTDYGVTWTSGSIFPEQSDILAPLAASMPSAKAAYVLIADNSQTQNILERIQFADTVKSTGGGGTGVVNEDPQAEIPFTAMLEPNAIQFSAAPAADARSIAIMDVLGRTWTTLALSPNAQSISAATSSFPSGIYFARLGTSVVEFEIP